MNLVESYLRESIPKDVRSRLTSICKDHGLSIIKWDSRSLEATDKKVPYLHYTSKNVKGISIFFVEDSSPFVVKWYCVVTRPEDRGLGWGSSIVNDILDSLTPCKIILLDESGGTFWERISQSRPDIEWEFET